MRPVYICWRRRYVIWGRKAAQGNKRILVSPGRSRFSLLCLHLLPPIPSSNCPLCHPLPPEVQPLWMGLEDTEWQSWACCIQNRQCLCCWITSISMYLQEDYLWGWRLSPAGRWGQDPPSKQTFQKRWQSTRDMWLYSRLFRISCTSSLTHHLHPRLSSLWLFSSPEKEPAEVKSTPAGPKVKAVGGLLLKSLPR